MVEFILLPKGSNLSSTEYVMNLNIDIKVLPYGSTFILSSLKVSSFISIFNYKYINRRYAKK